MTTFNLPMKKASQFLGIFPSKLIRVKPSPWLATGSGKSSIMNLLYRFYDPQEGEIRIDGQNIRHFSERVFAPTWALFCKILYLFTGTIASNVAMSQEHIDRNAVKDALKKKVGAWPFVERLEKGNRPSV